MRHAPTSRFIRVNGLALHYLEWGKAGNPALILLHGGSAHAHWWDHIAPALARTHRVLALDLRGHGESAWTHPPAYEVMDYVADLEGVVTALELDAPVLMGHSLGGFVALCYATTATVNRGVFVIVDIGPRLRPSRTILKSDRVAMVRQPCDLEPQLTRIAGPILFIRGQHSKTLSAERLAHLAHTCPRATGIEISQAGHHVFLDQPATFLDTVTTFLHETSKASV